MKKLILAISTIFLVLFGAMTISASAARYTSLPITMNQYRSGVTSMFTMTDFDVYVSLNETPKYTKSTSIYITGDFNQGSSMALSFYCYDASGNHLKTFTKTMYASDLETYEDGSKGFYTSFDSPDVTASIEVGTSYPGSWTNTYHYCKYMNVHSADGRALGIHDLLLPVYENVGWHGPVDMYSLKGDWIEVPYNQVAAYQKAGWYLWPDYYYQSFKKDYDNYTRNGNYSSAFYEVEWAISELTGTYYEASLYKYKTNLMDAWRKKINGPLAYCSSYVSSGKANITLRNVSYNSVKAYKYQFDCYNIFNEYLGTRYYETTNDWIYSGNTSSRSCSGLPSGTDHISNFKITQVVYSDGTSWYK